MKPALFGASGPSFDDLKLCFRCLCGGEGAEGEGVKEVRVNAGTPLTTPRASKDLEAGVRGREGVSCFETCRVGLSYGLGAMAGLSCVGAIMLALLSQEEDLPGARQWLIAVFVLCMMGFSVATAMVRARAC